MINPIPIIIKPIHNIVLLPPFFRISIVSASSGYPTLSDPEDDLADEADKGIDLQAVQDSSRNSLQPADAIIFCPLYKCHLQQIHVIIFHSVLLSW